VLSEAAETMLFLQCRCCESAGQVLTAWGTARRPYWTVRKQHVAAASAAPAGAAAAADLALPRWQMLA
jgi:hypothetical protein